MWQGEKTAVFTDIGIPRRKDWLAKVWVRTCNQYTDVFVGESAWYRRSQGGLRLDHVEVTFEAS